MTNFTMLTVSRATQHRVFKRAVVEELKWFTMKRPTSDRFRILNVLRWTEEFDQKISSRIANLPPRREKRFSRTQRYSYINTLLESVTKYECVDVLVQSFIRVCSWVHSLIILFSDVSLGEHVSSFRRIEVSSPSGPSGSTSHSS